MDLSSTSDGTKHDQENGGEEIKSDDTKGAKHKEETKTKDMLKIKAAKGKLNSPMDRIYWSSLNVRVSMKITRMFAFKSL